MSTLPLCCFVHLILSSLIYGQRRKGKEKRGGKRGLYWMSLEVRWTYWKLSSAQPRSEMNSSGVPLECAVEVGRSRGSSFCLWKLLPKQNPHFGFDNLDFPWWCPWLCTLLICTPLPFKYFFLPEIVGPVLWICLWKADKNMFCWRWQGSPLLIFTRSARGCESWPISFRSALEKSSDFVEYCII